MEKWEYRFEVGKAAIGMTSGHLIDAKFQTNVNQLGEQGWELAGVVNDTSSGSGYQAEIRTTVTFVFKRRKP
jgi:hypothetical protein